MSIGMLNGDGGGDVLRLHNNYIPRYLKCACPRIRIGSVRARRDA